MAPEPELPDVEPEPVVRRNVETPGAWLVPPKSWLASLALALVVSAFVILVALALVFAPR
jgi:hypothetical protein